MIGIEERQLIVILLDEAADAIGHASNLVDMIARRDIDTVRAMHAEADPVVTNAGDMIRALRTIARRLER